MQVKDSLVDEVIAGAHFVGGERPYYRDPFNPRLIGGAERALHFLDQLSDDVTEPYVYSGTSRNDIIIGFGWGNEYRPASAYVTIAFYGNEHVEFSYQEPGTEYPVIRKILYTDLLKRRVWIEDLLVLIEPL